MQKNIWKTITKPFFVLAPMDDVTDVVFRELVTTTAPPDVFFTEFTNVEAMCSKGRESQIRRLLYTEHQRPIVAQIWGLDPLHYEETAKLVQEMGFDGIDINMGCPERTVVKNGACAAFIKNPKLAREVIEATRKGAPNLPLSVKTRIGFSTIQTEEWISFLLEQKLDAIIVHGRTAKEMSKVPAHWDEIAKVVVLRNSIAPETIVIGNGDVKNYAEGLVRVQETHVDGIMIGRGIFTNMWAFEKSSSQHMPSIQERIALLVHHVELYEKQWGTSKRFEVLKKFFKIYISEFPGASELRVRFMETTSYAEVYTIAEEFLHLQAFP